jgi:hypothetical protein
MSRGVVRQQLLVDPGIPYTSHSSSACVVLDIPDQSLVETLLSRAGDMVFTKGWLRPRFWGQRAVFPVVQTGKGHWESVGKKRQKNK